MFEALHEWMCLACSISYHNFAERALQTKEMLMNKQDAQVRIEMPRIVAKCGNPYIHVGDVAHVIQYPILFPSPAFLM